MEHKQLDSLNAQIAYIKSHLPQQWDIAIDGDAATGKDTIGQTLSSLFSVVFINSGDFYRSIAVAISDLAVLPERERHEKIQELIGGKMISLSVLVKEHTLHFIVTDLRKKSETDVTPYLHLNTTSVNTALIAKFPEVRTYVNAAIEDTIRSNNVIMAGRDIGLQVIPDALFHIILTADSRVRAQRRYDELIMRDSNTLVTVDSIHEEIQERDKSDHETLERIRSSLRDQEGPRPTHTIRVDTTDLSPEEVLSSIIHSMYTHLISS